MLAEQPEVAQFNSQPRRCEMNHINLCAVESQSVSHTESPVVFEIELSKPNSYRNLHHRMKLYYVGETIVQSNAEFEVWYGDVLVFCPNVTIACSILEKSKLLWSFSFSPTTATSFVLGREVVFVSSAVPESHTRNRGELGTKARHVS